jgi:hypothetical protein
MFPAKSSWEMAPRASKGLNDSGHIKKQLGNGDSGLAFHCGLLYCEADLPVFQFVQVASTAFPAWPPRQFKSSLLLASGQFTLALTG